MSKRWLSMSVIALMMGLGFGAGTSAQAADQAAVTTAPTGISLARSSAAIAPAPETMSHARIVTTPDGSAIALTSGPSQFGAAWSTAPAALDLRRNQTLGVWVNLGARHQAGSDGLALVLQNNRRGAAAMPAMGSRVVGETLGVLATDTNQNQTSAQKLSQTAIQRSWALGVVPTSASATAQPGAANAFATLTGTDQHLTTLYPALASTYRRLRAGGLLSGWLTPARNAYALVPKTLNSVNDLADGRWHHLTLTWNAQAGTMTTTYDDRNPATAAPQPGVSRTVPLDRQAIDPSHTGHVRWGLTATTNRQDTTTLVVVDQTPAAAQTSAVTRVTDLTQHRAVTTGSSVNAGDRVSLTLRLANRNPQATWAAIAGQLHLPADLRLTRGQWVAANGQTSALSSRDLHQAALPVALKRGLTPHQTPVKLHLTGRIAAVPTTQKVAATTSRLTSNLGVTRVTTPDFTVAAKHALTLAVTSGQRVQLPSRQGTMVTGRVRDRSGASHPAVVLQTTLNGLTRPAVTVAPTGTFKVHLQADQLRIGPNRLQLTAMTAKGTRRSAPVTVNIEVPGSLQFLMLNTASGFEPGRFSGQNQFVQRRAGWQIVVQDTRGTGKQWTLDAQTTPFTDAAGHRLAGGPVTVTATGTTPLNTSPTPILTHRTDDQVADGVTNVVAGWTDHTGVLLEVDGGTPTGTYRGTITWTLTDAPS